MKSALSELVYVAGGDYRFRLTADYSLRLNTGWRGYHEFYDGDACWMILRDDVLTIKSGYSWDGCSPCWKVFGKWIGTPTPASAVVPSLIHDGLYQWLGVECAPWDKKDADAVFYNLMREHHFLLKGTYHGAVYALGAAFRRIFPNKGNLSCGEH